MSKNEDYLKEINRKYNREKKNQKRQQLLQEAENDSLNHFEGNQTANERAMEMSEKAAPLLELDDNAENRYKPKDRLHKRKKAKEKSGEFTDDMQSQQMQELTEDPINKDEHSRKKRKKHPQREEQLENHEVIDIEECEVRKKHKKKQRLKETGNDPNLCEESNNNSQIITPPETSKHTQKSRKRKKPEDSNLAKERRRRYIEKINQDPVRKEQYLVRKREIEFLSRQRRKERNIGNNNTDSNFLAKVQRKRDYMKLYVKKLREDPVKREQFLNKKKAFDLKYREMRKNKKKIDNDEAKAKAKVAKAEERIARRKASAKRANKKYAAKKRAIKNSASNKTETTNASVVREQANETVDGLVKSPILANEPKHLNVANSKPINNIPVRRKAKNSIAKFTIDSTASVPALLEHFERKNKPFIWIYRRLFAKVTARLATTRSHYLMSGLPLNTFADDFNGCLPSRYYERFAYKCTMPTVTTRLKNLAFKDPVTTPMSFKRDWKSDFYFGLSRIQRALLRTQKRNDKVYTTTEHLVKMTMFMDKDPDPYFNDDYNWYFAGNGNLHVISVNEADCLLHSQLTRLFLSKFSRRKLLTKKKPLISYDCGDGNNIFETICNSNNFVVLRLKHKVHILKLTTEDGALKFQNIKDIDSKLPFTSIQFDDYQKNILYITKLDGTLSIVNLDLMKCRTLELMKGASLENNWNKVIALDQVSFCHLSRNCLRIFDKRTNSVVYEFSDLKSKQSEFQCDEMTAIIKCEDAPFVYLVTSHFMFLMDLRWQGDYKPRLIRRWTHQMQNVPAYISQIKHDVNKDFVCISSQWPEDSVLITSDTEIYNGIELPTSITLPYSLPTFESTLDAAKSRMLCVDIYHPLEQRIYTSVTGNCVMSADDNVIILTLNSLGDIFAYTLYPEHLERDDDSLERLHEWGSTMTRERFIYESCSVIDISHIWKSLKQVPSDRVLGGFKLLRNKELKFSEQVVHDIVDSGEIDGALLDAWFDDEKQTKVEEKALNIDLHFSDSE